MSAAKGDDHGHGHSHGNDEHEGGSISRIHSESGVNHTDQNMITESNLFTHHDESAELVEND